MTRNFQTETRVCLNPKCGKTFEVGGRGNAPRGRLWCSRRCHGTSRAIDKERACEGCGRMFTPTARGVAGRDRRFHSRECASTGRILASVIPDLSVPDAAYLAGLVDGEGSIFVMGKPGGPPRYLRVVVTNTSLPVLDWLTSTVGGSVTKKATYVGPLHETMPCFTWTVNGENARSVLNQILPYMVIKREKAISSLELAIGLEKKLIELRSRVPVSS